MPPEETAPAFEAAVLAGLIETRRLLSRPEGWRGGRGCPGGRAVGMEDPTGRILETKEYGEMRETYIFRLLNPQMPRLWNGELEGG